MENSNPYKSKQLFEIILQLGLVFLILGFCIKLLLPFMMPILWAIILAIVFYPAFNFLQKKLKGRKSLASFIIIAVLLIIIIAPTVLFVNSVTASIIRIKNRSREWYFESGNTRSKHKRLASNRR